MQVRAIAAEARSIAAEATSFCLIKSWAKIKAVKPRSQADCKAFTARIAVAALSQSARFLLIRRFLHMLCCSLLPDPSRPFPSERRFPAGDCRSSPNIHSARLWHLLTVSRPCRLIRPQLALGCTTVVAAGYCGEFWVLLRSKVPSLCGD